MRACIGGTMNIYSLRDYFVVSQLFSVPTHARFFKLGSKAG